MRKEKKELMRVQSILDNDRLSAGDNFIELLVTDIKKLLSDYFDFNELPEINFKKLGDRYKVEIGIYASRIKAFDYLPKD